MPQAQMQSTPRRWSADLVRSIEVCTRCSLPRFRALAGLRSVMRCWTSIGAMQCFFCFYVFFVSIAVMNIVTGIFVDSAINSARSDQQEMIQELLYAEESYVAALQQIF